MPEATLQAPAPEAIREVVVSALAEDVGEGDLSAASIPAVVRVTAKVITRQEAVLCGQGWFEEVFGQLDPGIRVRWALRDGDAVHADQTLCELQGPARAILTGERTALNFLQTLSATATETRKYVDAIAGTGARILDTRKTLPGLRQAQKYAVACGGGTNHRMGLYDGVLIKENHILAAGSIGQAVTSARRCCAGVAIEVETETLEEVEQALAAGADIILLDNFHPTKLREAVSLNRRRARLEASGGITLHNVRAIADTGVDYISIGSLTKDVHAVDLSLRVETA